VNVEQMQGPAPGLLAGLAASKSTVRDACNPRLPIRLRGIIAKVG